MLLLRAALAATLLLTSAQVQAGSDSGTGSGSGSGSGSGTGSGTGTGSGSGSDSDSGTGSGSDSDSESGSETAGLNISPGALPTLAAIFPGVLVHGAGHYVAGDKETALQLVRWQAIGLGMAASAALYLQFSGGSRYANAISIPMLVSGTGLMLNTFVADLYGSAGGTSDISYSAPTGQSATLGYAYINDPQFKFRHFTRASAHLERGDLHVDPLLWAALDDDNQRARLPLSYHFLSNSKGEYFEGTGAFTAHHFGDEGFSTYVGELSLGVRIEMRRIGRSLTGSFATMSAGIGLQETRYQLPGIGSDRSALLLGHFGYGFYMPRSGELELYYEHRRDTFTAGTSPSARNGSGFLGHFGLQLRQPLSDRFAIHAQAEIGSAYLVTSGLEVQWGDKE